MGEKKKKKSMFIGVIKRTQICCFLYLVSYSFICLLVNYIFHVKQESLASFQSCIFMLQQTCIISVSFPLDTIIVYLIYLQFEKCLIDSKSALYTKIPMSKSVNLQRQVL